MRVELYHGGMKRIGIYAGSFDPPTNGHLWMIQQGAALFDELVVVLGVNPDKKSFLTAAMGLDGIDPEELKILKKWDEETNA